MITEEQLDHISVEINKSNISNQLLKDDLIDHMCCLIEIDIKKGLSYDQAYQKAFLQTSPNGYEEIQRETLFLLNKNKIIIMKKFTYISGYFFSLAMMIGGMMKTLHMMGASLILFVGVIGFSFIFLPLLLLNQLKGSLNQHLSEKYKWIAGTVATIVLLLGALFKALHLPGGMVLIGVGVLLFSIGFLPFLFFRMYRQSVETI